jgi:hypothetical protein
MPRQNALAKRVDFAMKHWYHPRALEPEIETAYAGEKRRESHL